MAYPHSMTTAKRYDINCNGVLEARELGRLVEHLLRTSINVADLPCLLVRGSRGLGRWTQSKGHVVRGGGVGLGRARHCLVMSGSGGRGLTSLSIFNGAVG
jgi:hypothetical protein